MFFLPVCQHLVRCLTKRCVGVGQRRIDHRQFVRVGADRLDIATHGDAAVRGADETVAEAFHHRLHAPVLPQKRMPPPGAEIGDPEPVKSAKLFDFLPKLGHRAGIEDLQLELVHFPDRSARAQLHQNRQRRNLPQHDFGPFALEGQLELAIALFQMVGRQAHILEPLHEIRAKHLAFAVKHVAAQPGAFAAAERQGLHVVKLFTQLALVNQIGQPDRGGAVDQRKCDARVGLVAKHRLAHQQFVKIGVDQRADDRVDLPFVIIDAGCNVYHSRTSGLASTISALQSYTRGAHCLARSL